MLARIIALVVPLGFDTLAVAIALGLRGIRPLRPALVFAAFETLMPVVGISVGQFPATDLPRRPKSLAA